MPLSTDEAARSLDDVAVVHNRSQKWTRFKGPDLQYILWGIVWVVSFTLQQFLPDRILHFGNFSLPLRVLPWYILLPPAILVTILIARKRSAVSGPEDKRIGILWGVLFGYAFLWTMLLWPFIDANRFLASPRPTALISTVPMAAYIMMGLWGCGNYMIWLGLSMIALTLIGLFLLPAWFYIWMAVFGGGALLIAGIHSRRQWRQA